MRDHFETIDDERQQRGDPPLHEELINLLAEHERMSGTVKKIVRSQDKLKKALGKKGIKLLLDYEALMTDRTCDAEMVAYNLGFEHGHGRGRAEQIDAEEAQQLAVAISGVIVRMGTGERAVLQALSGLLAGLAGR